MFLVTEFAIALCCGQSADSAHFEIVTITARKSADVRRIWRGGPDTDSPDRLVGQSQRLRDFINWAYPRFQGRIIGGPELDGRYDLTAMLPHGSTSSQLSQMFANLLAEKFGLTFHSVTKTIPAYALVVVSGAEFSPLHPDPKSTSPAPDPSGFTPSLPNAGAWRVRNLWDTTEGMDFGLCSMGQVADALQGLFDGRDVPVIDHTGITGKVTFTLQGLPSRFPLNRAGAQNPMLGRGVDTDAVTAALVKQVGLKLVPIQIDVQMMVIDHVEYSR